MMTDFHTHIFPDELASHARKSLEARMLGAKMVILPTIENTLELERQNGIDRIVTLSIATKPSQQRNVNDFAASVNGGPIMAFGSVHPKAPDAFEELERVKDLGLKGIKLHPFYQDFRVDDETFFPFYEKISSLGLITVFHAGLEFIMPNVEFIQPEALAKALKYFDGAPVIAAHLGGFLSWDEVERYLVGENVYFDTAYIAGRLPAEQALRIIRSHGANRVLFGTDMPWSSPAAEREFIEDIGLTDDELSYVLHRTADELLGAVTSCL
ncbi:MAG: amidohydrolase family protein [Clostridiales bacterium]|nr:amidohydrolase family protein [Clostridiales bacterium]